LLTGIAGPLQGPREQRPAVEQQGEDVGAGRRVFVTAGHELGSSRILDGIEDQRWCEHAERGNGQLLVGGPAIEHAGAAHLVGAGLGWDFERGGEVPVLQGRGGDRLSSFVPEQGDAADVGLGVDAAVVARTRCRHRGSHRAELRREGQGLAGGARRRVRVWRELGGCGSGEGPKERDHGQGEQQARSPRGDAAGKPPTVYAAQRARGLSGDRLDLHVLLLPFHWIGRSVPARR
jgi:hypothetical protein